MPDFDQEFMARALREIAADRARESLAEQVRRRPPDHGRPLWAEPRSRVLQFAPILLEPDGSIVQIITTLGDTL